MTDTDTIWLAQNAFYDGLENDENEALYYKIVGYFTDEASGQAWASERGLIRGWPAPEGVPERRLVPVNPYSLPQPPRIHAGRWVVR